MGKVKGTAISGRLRYAQRRGGDDAVRAVVAAISDAETREQLADGRALKSAWYPFETLVETTVAIDRLFGKGDLGILIDVGGDVAEADLNSVYKLFIAVATPQYLIDKAASLWRNYYDTGELVVAAREPQRALIELRNFDTPHRAHCLSVLGWMIRSLQLCGCKDVVGHHETCRAIGHGQCLFEASWR